MTKMLESANTKSSVWPRLVIAILALVFLYLAYLTPPGADTLWRLHIADNVLAGKTLYRDIIEVNPPLWFWGAIPASILGGYWAVVAINLVSILGAVFVFGKLVALNCDARQSHNAMVGLAAALFLVSIGEIGQREQAFLIACALWSALIACRIDSKPMPIWLVLLATCFCGYGFALKHYFVVVPILTEFALLMYRRRNYVSFRLETAALAGLAMVYASAVIYLTPDFLGSTLDLVQASYEVFGTVSAVAYAVYYERILTLTAFVALPVLALMLARQKAPLFILLTLCAIVAVVAVVVQGRFWRYHMIAANGLAITVVTLAWLDVLTSSGRKRIDIAAKCLLPIGIGALFWIGSVHPTVSSLRTNGQPYSATLKALVAREPISHHIVILSIAPDHAFYPLARVGRPHWSRHFSMWMMPGLYAPQSDPAKEPARRTQRSRVLNEFVSDIMCTPPDLIVTETGLFRNAARTFFDPLAFLREEKVFSDWVDAHYTQKNDVGRYAIWRLKASKPSPTNCSIAR
jgi:hypothetical protein